MQFFVSNIATAGTRVLLALLLMTGLGACGGDSNQRSTSSSEQQAQKIDSMFASLDADEQQSVDQEGYDQTDSDFQEGGEQGVGEAQRNGMEQMNSGRSQDTEDQQNTGWNEDGQGADRVASEEEGAGGSTADQETSGRQRDTGGRQNTDQRTTDSQQRTSGQESSGGQEDIDRQQTPDGQQDTDRQQETSDSETVDQDGEGDRTNADGRQETNTGQQQERENQGDSSGQDDAVEQNGAGEQQTGSRRRGNDQKTPLERADKAYKDNQYDRAIKLYEEVDPPDVDQQSDTYSRVLGRLGEMYWKQEENYEKAVQAYESILDRDETRYQAHLNLARLAFELEDYDEMSAHLDGVDRLEYQIPVGKRLRVSLQSKYLRGIAKYKQTMNAETTRQKAQLGPRALQSLSSFIESVPSELQSEFQSNVEDAKEKRDEIQTLLQKLS